MPVSISRKRGGPRREPELTVEDVQNVGRQAKALLEIADHSQEDLRALGLVDARAVLERGAELATFRIPSARAWMLAGLGGGLSREIIQANYYRALQAIHAFAPLIAWKLAHKIDDENAPGSTKVLLEVAKGIGLLQPAEAVSTQKRLGALDRKALLERARLDPAGLKAELLGNT